MTMEPRNSMDQDQRRVLKTVQFKSDFKPKYTWLNILTDNDSKKELFLKSMEKYNNYGDASLAKSYKVDFDQIPNSQTIYKEVKTDSPDGFGLYKPSNFVRNFNSQHGTGASGNSVVTGSLGSDSSSGQRTTGQIFDDLFRRAKEAAMENSYEPTSGNGSG